MNCINCTVLGIQIENNLIGMRALSESWRTGARLAAVIEAVARLAAVIEWAWKAGIGCGKLELGLESWNLILQVHSSFCWTSQLELQFSIGIVYTIGLSTKAVLVARRAWLTLSGGPQTRTGATQTRIFEVRLES